MRNLSQRVNRKAEAVDKEDRIMAVSEFLSIEPKEVRVVEGSDGGINPLYTGYEDTTTRENGNEGILYRVFKEGREIDGAMYESIESLIDDVGGLDKLIGKDKAENYVDFEAIENYVDSSGMRDDDYNNMFNEADDDDKEEMVRQMKERGMKVGMTYPADSWIEYMHEQETLEDWIDNLGGWDYFLDNYIPERDRYMFYDINQFVQQVIDIDGYGHELNGWDGQTPDPVNVNGENYYVIRV